MGVERRSGGEEVNGVFDLQGEPGVPVYEQLVRHIKGLIVKGLLRPGDRLPSVRDLSAQVLANPNTVMKAYQELERQGVIATYPGKGTFVAERPPAGEERMQKLRSRLDVLVLEAAFWGVEEAAFQRWVAEAYRRVRGMAPDGRPEPAGAAATSDREGKAGRAENAARGEARGAEADGGRDGDAGSGRRSEGL
ncbi:GntR family transcriptional regulator [Hydrogenibacillus sp. N12]|nr:GntR family transcriptional regulator [Hydrogenibacillus sp. N12]